MLQQNTTKRLGYWLLLLHDLFEQDMLDALRDQDLDRRRWQVLHALAIGVSRVADIDAAFAPFLLVDRLDSYTGIVAGFAARGWVAGPDDCLALTEAGRAAHERAEVVVNSSAVGILDGLTESEFLAANDVLRRIAENMSGDSGRD